MKSWRSVLRTGNLVWEPESLGTQRSFISWSRKIEKGEDQHKIFSQSGWISKIVECSTEVGLLCQSQDPSWENLGLWHMVWGYLCRCLWRLYSFYFSKPLETKNWSILPHSVKSWPLLQDENTDIISHKAIVATFRRCPHLFSCTLVSRVKWLHNPAVPCWD